MVNVRMLRVKQTIAAVALASAAAACGGSGGGGGNPGGPSGGNPGPSGATITIGGNGAISPTSVTINPGESVTFVNNHNIPHNMASDPHPAHGDCPAINALGVISASSSKLTNALTTSRSCSFHDHNDPDNGALKGTITIR
jgi:plastocyanin